MMVWCDRKKKINRRGLLRRELQLKKKGKEVKECSTRWFSWVLEGIKNRGRS
jgi:hypothetical protein